MARFSRTLTAIAATAALQGAAPLVAAGTSAAQAAGYVTQDNDSLWNLAGSYEHGTRQQWMVAVLRRNPDAFSLANIHRLRSKVPLVLPTEAEAAAESRSSAEALIVRHFVGLNSNQPMPILPPQAAERDSGMAPATAPRTATPAPNSSAVTAPSPVQAAEPARGRSQSALPVTAAPTTTLDVPAPTLIAPPAGSSKLPATPAEPSPLRRWLPHAMAVTLALLALGLTWHVRRRSQPLAEAASTLFQDTIQLIRKSKPKVVTVSTAGADVARTVEQLTSTGHLVRTRDLLAQAPGDSDIESAVKLEIARAQLEVGRKDAAIAMLRSVLRSGAPAQRQAARQLLGSVGSA